jgi:hypothetical protein
MIFPNQNSVFPKMEAPPPAMTPASLRAVHSIPGSLLCIMANNNVYPLRSDPGTQGMGRFLVGSKPVASEDTPASLHLPLYHSKGDITFLDLAQIKMLFLVHGQAELPRISCLSGSSVLEERLLASVAQWVLAGEPD